MGLKSLGAFASNALVAAALLASGTAFAQSIDLSTGEGALKAFRKIQCSLKDGEPRTFSWHGHAYARVPGEKDRLLFRVEGMNIRQCVGVSDPKRGEGFRLLSREILLYQDPATGEVLKTWNNPWTGEQVEVVQVANDPVNSGPFFATSPDGRPFPWSGDIREGRWWSTATIPLFYTNPLGGAYQDYVGGKYHATEMFNFMGDTQSLLHRSRPAEVQVGWVRMSSWLPWMGMGGRMGMIYMHTAGKKLDDFDQLPEVMKSEIANNYPEYAEPPPADDQRPNETSWTYFKKIIDARGPTAGSAGGH
jgi:hypothetical protein